VAVFELRDSEVEGSRALHNAGNYLANDMA